MPIGKKPDKIRNVICSDIGKKAVRIGTEFYYTENDRSSVLLSLTKIKAAIDAKVITPKKSERDDQFKGDDMINIAILPGKKAGSFGF